jgi:hypothetical protein
MHAFATLSSFRHLGKASVVRAKWHLAMFGHNAPNKLFKVVFKLLPSY